MKLSPGTKIDELLKKYPFLEDYLVKYNPRFDLLKSKVARATVGKMANLKAVAKVGGIEIAKFLEDLAAEIRSQTGEEILVEDGRADRVERLKEVIRALHDGASVDEVKDRFAQAIAGAAAGEIAEMEQQMIAEGLPVEEVQRLCDVHVGAFKETLDEAEEVTAPPGHPVNTYMKANEKITALCNELAEAGRQWEKSANDKTYGALKQALDHLAGLENHYTRKENQLFPFLEKHEVTGPSKVMWGVHDEIRTTLKKAHKAVENKNAGELRAVAPKLARDVAEMVYKENKILFPMCMETLTEEEWAEVRRGEDELGYAFVDSVAPWTGAVIQATEASSTGDAALKMDTGALTLEQVNLIMTHLPLDLSFVDENDEVKYYSEGERHFPRSPAVIGRKVQNCHPPASVDVVERILAAFKSGQKDTADFWIDHNGRFVHIRYFAVRDAKGNYRGCLEMGQDVTDIKELKGERRLLDWG